jgi:hypothetical protein
MAVKPFENPYADFTSFKNVTLDVIMPALSATGWKLLCCVIRQTWGWADPTSPTGRKQDDQLSYSQLMEKTGIKSPTTISRVIQENLVAGYILRHRVGVDVRSGKPLYAYSLNTEYEFSAPKTGVLSTPKNGQLSTPKNGYTKNKDKPTNGDGESIQLLTSIGIELSVAQALAVKPLADIRGWVEYASPRQGLTNPAGLVVKRLQAGIPPPRPSDVPTGGWVACKQCGILRPFDHLCADCGGCYACCACDD